MLRLPSISALAATTALGAAAEIPPGVDGFAEGIKPFFEEHCIRCHGPDKSKGKLTVHTLDGDLAAGHELERWELILEMIEDGEMPPDDEPQPDDAVRTAVAEWIDAGLRSYVEQASAETPPPTARRLTNFEYQNTMRDILGIDLNFSENLLEDPTVPYKFNNSAELMRMVPEKIDRYLENARRAMASVIVDPEPPVVHKSRQEWKPTGSSDGLGADEISPWGNTRNSPGVEGMRLKSFPSTGEFRIRVKASAILPEGTPEIPLRLVMGYNLNENQSTLRMEPVGTVNLSNNPDHPEEFEFRGRIENYPVRPGKLRDGKPLPDTLTITAQNLFDDGTLNDLNQFLRWPRRASSPRAVVEWIEFEAPVTDVWPPAHHTDILFESPLRETDTPAYVREVLKRFVSRAFRRPATEDEIERFAKVFAIVSPEMESFEAAMRETLSMVLISPNFLFHTQADDGIVTPSFEMASKLSYFLWGSMPDWELLSAALDGRLADESVIEQQVLRLLKDERSNDFVDNFTRQWLSIDKSKTVPINKDLFPRFLFYVPAGERAGTEEPYRPTIRDYMIQETTGFVAELIRRNASAMQLVESDFAYLNEPLAVHYGIEGVHGIDFRPVPITPEQKLGGLLTHGSVLIGNGTGSAPHPIYRAVWLREAILGDEVAPPPAEVPALSDTAGESAEKALTIKDLLAKHRQEESCNDCHARLDPWGIPFEHYNAIGKYQPSVPKEGTRVAGFNDAQHGNLQGYQAYLDSINTQQIEAVSRVPNGPEIQGMEDLKAYLLKDRKTDIAENLVRRLLVYGMGRTLTYHDRFAVESLVEEAKRNDYRVRDMIVAVCKSDLFVGRTDHH
jgi:hypothetical protein